MFPCLYSEFVRFRFCVQFEFSNHIQARHLFLQKRLDLLVDFSFKFQHEPVFFNTSHCTLQLNISVFIVVVWQAAQFTIALPRFSSDRKTTSKEIIIKYSSVRTSMSFNEGTPQNAWTYNFVSSYKSFYSRSITYYSTTSNNICLLEKVFVIFMVYLNIQWLISAYKIPCGKEKIKNVDRLLFCNNWIYITCLYFSKFLSAKVVCILPRIAGRIENFLPEFSVGCIDVNNDTKMITNNGDQGFWIVFAH